MKTIKMMGVPALGDHRHSHWKEEWEDVDCGAKASWKRTSAASEN